MFLVTEEDSVAIREAFEREGVMSATIELQRRFPGITDKAKARDLALQIAGWTAQPEPRQ